MLSAGTNVEWLVEDLGLLATAAESHEVAQRLRRHRRCRVRARPPRARHTPLGLRGPRHPARPDARDGAARARAGGAGRSRAARRRPGRGGRGGHRPVDRDAAGRRRHERQPDLRPGAGRRHPTAGGDRPRCTEATTLGAGFLAGLATGAWDSFDDIAAAWRPRTTVGPGSDARPGALGGGGRAGRRLDARPVSARLLELPRPAAARKAVAPCAAPAAGPSEESCRVPTDDCDVPDPATAPRPRPRPRPSAIGRSLAAPR